MFEGRAKVKSDSSKFVPSFASWIVGNNEAATRNNGVGQKIKWLTVNAIVDGYRGEIGIGTENEDGGHDEDETTGK